jgi:hypothetical protein
LGALEDAGKNSFRLGFCAVCRLTWCPDDGARVEGLRFYDRSEGREEREQMSIEIPFTDEWMDAPEPVYQGGKPLLSPDELETLEERAAGAGESLQALVEVEKAKLLAKIAAAQGDADS